MIFSEKNVIQVADDRSFQMGVAILLVLLYHLSCLGFKPWFMSPFRFGYIGVDIFILLSGYGLCYSYQKNSLGLFYRRRILRLYPLYFLASLFHSCFTTFLNGWKGSLWDWMCNLTTLNYYKVGGYHIEWYICALLILYALFPLFYKLIYKMPNVMLIGSYIICGMISIYGDVDWTYDCLISRIPVYLFGISLFVSNKKHIRLYRYTIVTCLIGVFFFFLDYKQIVYCKFFWTTLITPVLMVGINEFSKCCKFFLWQKVIRYIGDKSLEIYVAQIFCMPIVTYLAFPKNSIFISISYWVLEFAFAAIVIVINKEISRLTSRVTTK